MTGRACWPPARPSRPGSVNTASTRWLRCTPSSASLRTRDCRTKASEQPDGDSGGVGGDQALLQRPGRRADRHVGRGRPSRHCRGQGCQPRPIRSRLGIVRRSTSSLDRLHRRPLSARPLSRPSGSVPGPANGFRRSSTATALRWFAEESRSKQPDTEPPVTSGDPAHAPGTSGRDPSHEPDHGAVHLTAPQNAPRSVGVGRMTPWRSTPAMCGTTGGPSSTPAGRCATPTTSARGSASAAVRR